MAITKLAFVAQPTTDMNTSKAFYELLGLEFKFAMPDMWGEFDCPDGKSIALDAVSPKKSKEKVTTYLALETDDIVAEVARLKEAGVTVAADVWENKDGDGNGVCKMAMIADPDGTPIMLHEIDPRRA